MKGLYQRGDVWWYRFTPAPGAAQVRESMETTDEAVAIAKAREMRGRAAVEVRDQMEACQTLIDSYVASLKKRRLSDETISSRKYILQGFAKDTVAATPRQITPAAAKTWFEARWGKNPNTADAYLSVVRYWFEWLAEEGKALRDPTADIVVPIIPMRKRRPFLLQDEARLVIDSCLDDALKFCLYCAIHSGLRKDEVIEAIPEWFDLNAGLIHIDTTPTFEPKDRDKRTIPLTEEFKGWLKEHYGKPEPFMLMPKVMHGKARYRWDFRARFEAHMQACGFGHVTFHDLRRTFASLLASKGVSIYKIAKWLGDDVDVVQDTYAHLIPQDDDINAVWKKPEQPRKATARRERRVSRPAHRRAAAPGSRAR